jgi:hypothetical protein
MFFLSVLEKKIEFEDLSRKALFKNIVTAKNISPIIILSSLSLHLIPISNMFIYYAGS